jgi:hypothetical protein
MPRMRIDDEAPGDPDCEVTVTPGAFAARALTTFVSFELTIAAESTGVRTVPMRSACVAVPAPVTTTSPSCSGFAASVKSCVMVVPGVSVTCTDTGLNPSLRASRVAVCPLARAAGTVNV